MRRVRDVAERFWSHVDRGRGRDDCWLWTGSLNHLGYARFYITIAPRVRVSIGAHHWAWEQYHDPVPEGLELDHLCRVRHCVNPAHLDPVTHQENARRGTSPVAANARKTHCPQGHPYSPENTRISPKGKRHCRTCNAEQARVAMRERYWRLKALRTGT